MTGTPSIPTATAELSLSGLKMESSKTVTSTSYQEPKGTKIETPTLKWKTVRKASTLCSWKWTGTHSLKVTLTTLGSVLPATALAPPASEKSTVSTKSKFYSPFSMQKSSRSQNLSPSKILKIKEPQISSGTSAEKHLRGIISLLSKIMKRRPLIKKILSILLLMGCRWSSLREMMRILQSVSKVTK